VSNNWKAAIVHVPYPAMKDEIHAWLVNGKVNSHTFPSFIRTCSG
jgi:hypothetical protein